VRTAQKVIHWLVSIQNVWEIMSQIFPGETGKFSGFGCPLNYGETLKKS
jgi:hypothetical protein